MWKYVSPRRRRVGLFLLAVLVMMMYAGWFFTRSSHIRREAKRTLEALTGADVDVDEASFSVFEGIRLYNVRVRIRGESFPFFTAEEVMLKHKPTTLLFEQRIEPTEIVCLRPVVNLEYENEASNAETLFQLAATRKKGGGIEAASLPRIWLNDGLLRTRVKQKGQNGLVVKEQQQQFKAQLMPKNSHTYEVTVQDLPRRGGEVPYARFLLDTQNGEIRLISGSATEQWAVHMPPEYRKWIDRYHFRGDFTLVEGPGTDPDKGRYEIALEDFSMKLPEDEGNLTLTEVRGGLRFTKQYVEMREITGKVEEIGKADFSLNGKYQGYAKTSPFEMKIEIRGLRFPDTIKGPLAKIVQTVRQEFQPEGVGNVTMTFRRDETGENICDGELSPQDATITYHHFPLTVHHVQGKVHFTQTGVDTVSFTARRDAAAFTIDGKLNRDAETGKTLYDVRVSAKEVALDDASRKAIPEPYHKVWDTLHPTGRSDVDVHVYKTAPLANARVDVDFHMKGLAGLCVDAFAYPLKNIFGEVTLRGRDVNILWARSRSGRMLAQAKGTITGLMTPEAKVDLELQATRVPLDKTLLNAAKGNVQNWLADLQPGGELGKVSARITKQGEEPADFDVTATLKKASFCYKKFAYCVTDAGGQVQITPEQAVLRDIQGLHNEAKVSISGEVFLRKTDSHGLGYDLAIHADAVKLDKEFHDALPDNLRAVWKSLSPAGAANIDVSMRSTGDDAQPDYRVIVEATDASLRYHDFPYTFQGVSGKAVVTPGVVTVEKMHTEKDGMQADVSGVIRHTPDGAQDVMLQITARNLPIDKELLAAVPSDVVPLVKRISPGGLVNADIQSLHITRPASGDISSGDVGGVTPPAGATWTAAGGVAFRDVVMDLGFGPRKMTGSIAGKSSQEPGAKLAIDADAELMHLAFKEHEITDLKGRLTKRADSDTLQIDKVSARAYDGKIDGEMTIQLTDPIHYEFSASVYNLDMAKLVNAAEKDRKKWVKLDGLLSGRLSFEATGGDHPKRQASGELELSRGHMFELPVILGLANVVYLQLPSESAFNRGFVNYHLKNDILKFDEIYLTGWDRQTKMGKGISILGSGKMNMKDETLDLTFLTGPPGDMPRLDEITEDILEAISLSLVEVHVTGTLKKPKMDSVPLSPLATIIRRLVEPSMKTE